MTSNALSKANKSGRTSKIFSSAAYNSYDLELALSEAERSFGPNSNEACNILMALIDYYKTMTLCQLSQDKIDQLQERVDRITRIGDAKKLA